MEVFLTMALTAYDCLAARQGLERSYSLNRWVQGGEREAPAQVLRGLRNHFCSTEKAPEAQLDEDNDSLRPKPNLMTLS